MAVSKLILGMNARNYLFLNKYNGTRAKRIADDKLATKRRLIKADIPTPGLITVFKSHADTRVYDWSNLSGDFVLKPSRGYGGEGILLVRAWSGGAGFDTNDNPITSEDLASKIFDILDGAHSLDSLPDVAFLEERVIVQSAFKKISAGGVPDVRIIVCNKVPIMAMLRLPTQESGGKANLHMGALGIGIDLRTGITTKGTLHNKDITYIPGGRTKVHGIKIPYWEDVLDIAARTQEVSLLGYAGVDIVIDERYGPQVLEVNARPGLSIQMANGESLRTRLERVAELKIGTIAKGIDLSKELFAEPVLSDIPTENNVLHVIEKIQIIGRNNKRKTVLAKIDTGAFRTALDKSLVSELDLEKSDESVLITAGSGSQTRKTVKVAFRLRGKDVHTTATYLDRRHMRFPVIVGRRDLKGFLVDPGAVQDHVQ